MTIASSATTAITCHTNLSDSAQAGAALGTELRHGLSGQRPDAVIVFASARHDYGALLRAIAQACTPKVMVGCSSAGEFTSSADGDGTVSAAGICSSEMHFTASCNTYGQISRTEGQFSGFHNCTAVVCVLPS